MPPPETTGIPDPELAAVVASLPPEWRKPAPAYTGVIHPSSFNSNPTCPRRYMYTERLRWGFEKRSEPLVIGSLAHRLLAGVYSGLSLPESVEAVAGGVAAALDALEDPKAKTAGMKAWNVSRVMVEHYLKHFTVPSGKVLAVEQTIQSTSHEHSEDPATTIVGTLDAVTQDAAGDTWLEDHKTTSMLPSVRAAGLSFDSQSRLYRFLRDSSHHDLTPCVGVIHNILMTPGIRLTKNETYDDYFKRVGEWYETEMAAEPGAVPFMRSYVRWREPALRDNMELKEQLDSASDWCHRALYLDHFPRDCHACRQYRSVCPHMCLCDADLATWPDTLVAKFQHLEPPLDAALKGHASLSDDVELATGA